MASERNMTCSTSESGQESGTLTEGVFGGFSEPSMKFRGSWRHAHPSEVDDLGIGTKLCIC